MKISIQEIIQDSFSIDKELYWLKCRTGGSKVVAFWGTLGGKNRNICSLKNQILPVAVTILESEECEPTDHEKKEYGLNLSVPETVSIQINSEF